MALLIALFLDLLGTGINFLYYPTHRSLLLAYRMHGGEITSELGFGVRAVHICGMTPDAVTTHSLSFSLFGFLLFLVPLFLLVFLLLVLAERLPNRR